MNRLMGKKKGRDDGSGPRPSMDSEPSGPFRMFGKSKKSTDDRKQDVDLTSALPPSDDFRTSLLMTGLSARFSMLREQDDPSSKLGKASDDSVLFPKRQSRMMDFGALSPNLHDIAEVESLRAPEFARVHSFQSSDDNASMSGSIMNRSKPTDGNNLFGGRQKIYKISAGGSKAGAMSGRALYDHDVAQSSFQKWRQTDKTQRSSEEDGVMETSETEPSSDYNQRRETNSTTSSGPSVGRNSTAATSVNSTHPAASLKDWQSSLAVNSVGSNAGLERSVIRTRRLYEQGLTQDLQEQQTSALSRMDTLSRQKPYGARTPDLTPPVPSPTNATFGDRGMDRRPIIGKSSAPNLRSYSPSANSPSLMSMPNAGTKFASSEHKAVVTRSPPLSPPISEADDHFILPIQPGDRGKATALGVFNRPTQQYDDSKFAQRQRQMQQGRETPTLRDSSDTDSRGQGPRSRSSSSRRVSGEKTTALQKPPTGHANTSFFDDSDDGGAEAEPEADPSISALPIERPDDQEHPAFRKSALPTPLSLSSRSSDDMSVSNKKPSLLETGNSAEPAEDSPTLGPGAGLSGMVRQHLRNASEASSVYVQDDDSDALPTSQSSDTVDATGQSNNWGLTEADWNLDDDETNPSTPAASTQTGEPTVKENEEFARHLADGARRVREKLTSYVDPDSERPTPPPIPQDDLNRDTKQNALGVLRTKSSKGSLFSKRDRSQERSKSRSQTASPARRNLSSEQGAASRYDEQQPESSGLEKDETAHAGLKAFRQARRELQKMKELEVQQRHKSSPKKNAPGMADIPTHKKVGTRDGGGPPPAMFNRMPSEEYRRSGGSSAGSRQSSERDRSGSETSTNGQPSSRGRRPRDGSVSNDEFPGGSGGPRYPRPSPGMRSPVKQPHHPGNGISPGLASPPQFTPNSLPQSPHEYESGASSPVVSNGAEAFYAKGGATFTHTEPPTKRVVQKRDISEPTFISSTSRVPTVPLDGQQQSRPRNGSLLGAAQSTPNLHASVGAPPLPPFNPRRKAGQIVSRESGDGVSHTSTRRSPSDGTFAGHMSEDEDATHQRRQRLHRMTSENDVGSRERNMSPRAIQRPPLPHSNMSGSSIPGGMI